MKELDVAIEAAKAAGEVLQEEYQKAHIAQLKPDNTLVSDADLAAEKIIIKIIKKHFPDHAIFSEEAGSSPSKSDYLWIIDPLDGSANFLHHLGIFCTAIAVVKQNQPLAAAVHLPLTGELFTVGEDQAALNGKPIQPSTTPDAKQSLIAWGRGSVNHPRHTHLYSGLTPHIRSLRLFGSVVIQACYVGCGYLDAFLNSDCKLYDAIAGAMIAEAAGAKVTDFAGNLWQPNFKDPTSTSDVLISNPHIHATLVQALRKAESP